MLEILKKIRRVLLFVVQKIIPYPLRLRIDASRFGIVKFMEYAAKEIAPASKVLDAGAGSRPYQKYFSHTQYQSTDFEDAFNQAAKKNHDFICSLDKIPQPDNTYDVIINTQVLEHVANPQAVINEFYRVLKNGGKLFLTAPQGWGLHGEPYNFFNFTCYGLKLLFE
jgi:SAM-dependent methyltransferase